MATLVLAAAGAAIGGPLGAVGGMAGEMLGKAAGSVLDQALLGGIFHKKIYGPRMNSMPSLSSNEGAPIPRLYGKARLGGQLIWATRFLETTTRSSGGKGGPTTTIYNYYANFAVGICEGEIAYIRRVWADGKEIDLTTLTMRVHTGSQTQAADPLIIAKEGVESAPAYRGVAYAVFELMPLADFGNRIPQISFEVVRPVQGLAQMIRAVNLIPGAGEFVYSQAQVMTQSSEGVSQRSNRHQFAATADWTASIDALQALCPNIENVGLVVSWFGDDLRAGSCSIAPRVEAATLSVIGANWSVAGLMRSDARVVSQVDGTPAFGGTPSDDTIVAAIRDLHARGLKVTLYPFVMMDIAADNNLSDPWSGGLSQPKYPWRGRITCHPAPGLAGSPDGTPGATSQIAAFFGSANPVDTEWSFRRLILHYAALAVSAGGVEAMLIGSELRGLTRVRSGVGVYPAVSALQTLAGDVRTILGPGCKIGYAADWSEYGAHVMNNGAEVRFPLDPLWANANIDFIGIDAYWPLSDWRDGTQHADAALASSIYDRGYLISRFGAGEDFDFYYASDSDRQNQIRSDITDGAFGKPWIFRAKDIKSWWLNPHFERLGGAELAAPTDWIAQSKPIWLTEFGCPAIDRGSNQPNVFVDARSSESSTPYFSRGSRDDLIQTRVLEACHVRFDPRCAGFDPAWNPVSSFYAGTMVDPAHIHIWCWDARPYPVFPQFSAVWADAGNWYKGHWITGRIEGAPLDHLIAQIMSESGAIDAAFLPESSPAVDGFVDGYVLDNVMSVRGALQPLCELFGVDGRISAGAIGFSGRLSGSAAMLSMDDLVPARDGNLVQITRAQETELPHEIVIAFSNSEDEFQAATVSSRRVEGYSRRKQMSQSAVIMPACTAQSLADILLHEIWAGREKASFTIGPQRMDIEIGDLVYLPVDAATKPFRISQITEGLGRELTATSVEPTIYERVVTAAIPAPRARPRFPGPPRVHVLDLAQTPSNATIMQRLAVFADPWPGSIAVYKAIGSDSYTLATTIDRAAQVGTTLSEVPAGVVGRWDCASSFDVVIANGTLSSCSDAEVFAGQNLAAIKGDDGNWEIIKFANAELIAESTYRLSRFLRGLGGEEFLAARAAPAGAPFVMLDSAVVTLAEGIGSLGVVSTYKIGPARLNYSDPSFIDLTTQVTGKALMPYSPVQLSARRSASGVSFTFLRRGRLDADGWEAVDIPLGEESEGYEMDIYNNAKIVRTLTSVQPQIFYAAANELADFGAMQSTFSISLYQISASVGRGFPLTLDVCVD